MSTRIKSIDINEGKATFERGYKTPDGKTITNLQIKYDTEIHISYENKEENEKTYAYRTLKPGDKVTLTIEEDT